MEWNTYYDRFYDWSDSTRLARISELSSFGPSGEIIEIAEAFFDEKAASRLVSKAATHGVVFSAEEICHLSGLCSTATTNALLKNDRCRFTQDQLEELSGCADPELIAQIAKENGVSLFRYADNEIEAVMRAVQGFSSPATTEPCAKADPDAVVRLGLLSWLNRIFCGRS